MPVTLSCLPEAACNRFNASRFEQPEYKTANYVILVKDKTFIDTYEFAQYCWKQL